MQSSDAQIQIEHIFEKGVDHGESSEGKTEDEPAI